MKIFFGVFLIFGHLVCFAEPHLVFEKVVEDFGTITRGEKRDALFRFTNKGSSPLQITGIHSSCGCAVTYFDQSKLYVPEETGEIRLRFDSTDFRGEIHKIITIMTNEKQHPTESLRLQASIKDEFKIDPPMVHYGSVQSLPVREIIIESLGTSEIEGFDADNFDAQMTKIDATKWKISLTPRSSLPVGQIKTELVIRTSSQHLPHIRVPIRGVIEGQVHLGASYVEFGTVKKGKSVIRSIELSYPNDIDIAIDRIDWPMNAAYDSSMIEARIENKNLVLQLKNPTGHQGSTHGRVYLRSSDARQPLLSLDFYGYLGQN